MIKKLCLILFSFILMFSCLSVAAAPVAESVDTNMTDLEFMQKLGAFPEDLQSGEALTRSELAKIYFRIMLHSQADAEYVELNYEFDDIDGNDFAANFVAQAGIMNGVGYRTFNPTGTLSYPEIVKTIVCFMGYGVQAEENGGYPGGYMVYGARLGFDDLAPNVPDAVVTTDIAAALFRQALNSGLAQVIYKDNGIVYTNREGADYAETYMGIHRIEGIVTATYIENTVVTGDSEDYFNVHINGKKFRLTPENYKLNELLGYRVEAYYKENAHGENELLLYDVTDTEILTITEDDFAGASADEQEIYYYNNNGKERAVDISNAYVIYNGELCESYDDTVINPFADTKNDAEIRCIDNDGDGKVNIVLVDVYRNYVISKVVNNKIYNKYHPSIIFDISEIEDGDIPVKNVIGNTIPLSALEEKDIISVYTTLDGELSKIIVSVDSYVGEIETIIPNAWGAPKIKIDGVIYQCANSITDGDNKEFAKIKLGQKVRVYFNFAGEISNIEVSEYINEKIGYLVDAAKTDNSFEDEYALKILTSKGSMLVALLGEKVELNGEKRTSEYVFDAFGKAPNGLDVKRQPIKYVYNEDKKIVTEIKLVDDSIDETSDGFYQYKNIDPDALTYYRSASKNFGGHLMLSATTNVFLVASEDNRFSDDNYSVTDSSYFNDGTQAGTPSFVAYGSTAYNPTAEILVIETTPSTFFALGTIVTVDECTLVLKDDEPVYKLTGFVNGKAAEYYAEESVFSDNEPECGDVIRIALDEDRMVVKQESVFDASEKTFGAEYITNPTSSNFYERTRYAYGTVEYQDDYAVTVKSTDISTSAVVTESYPVSSFVVYEYKITARDIPQIELADKNVIEDRYNNNVASNVFIYTDSGNPKFMIVYN